MTIASMLAIADYLDKKANVGYDQSQRWTFIEKSAVLEAEMITLQAAIEHIVSGRETDCSASCGAIARLGGYPVDLSGTWYTGNFTSKMKSSGYFQAISVKGWSSKRLYAYLKNGDFLIGPGHVVFVRLGGARGWWWSAESDERGRSTGGKAGGAGDHVGYRKPYMRSRGWTYIVRAYPSTKFRGQVLAYYDQQLKSSLDKAMHRLQITAPWDGPLWKTFIDDWTALDRGMVLSYPGDTYVIPEGEQHAFVVLGSTTSKMTRRLDAALPAIQANPQSKIILTGGVKRGAATEAAWMKAWLVSEGVDASRIILETKSSSTIGNAKYSMPILVREGIKRYTLVSDASHLRRASVLFLAAQLDIETTVNKKTGILPMQALAFNDYTGVVATEKPVSSATRHEVVKETAALLGLTVQYNAAL